ncbi:RNA polymerase sigma-70 factor ECF family protein [Candidatus Nitrosoglobus terrae]|uniref:RNA polymerase sigma-70 factor ECF family protein n=1 Tax=Candidatus Nitrosoglobus terrae TaxID=1630141 RepID=A0A1Q2SPC2_9GAMM|nr:sigma-70 family RNA polymerase sigma factor [Candidatus Nitrosoglobus terrae]BAW80972.1 RNA polymerase sigma-70 factor ECF family protein [Candidatus Nitrosoglobus terrae]
MAIASIIQESAISTLAREEDNCGDAILMGWVRQGNHTAFTRLVERHAERFYRLAYRYLQHRQEAEDIVQQSFTRLWGQPELWNPAKQVQFTTWFYRVIINACLDARKGRRIWVEVSEEINDTALLPDDRLQKHEEQRVLEREIQALPERQQTALNLCFYEGISNQEAAEIMGIGLKALQSLLIRAKTTLKERMKICL